MADMYHGISRNLREPLSEVNVTAPFIMTSCQGNAIRINGSSVMRIFDVFSVAGLSRLLNEQSCYKWFETKWRPRDVTVMICWWLTSVWVQISELRMFHVVSSVCQFNCVCEDPIPMPNTRTVKHTSPLGKFDTVNKTSQGDIYIYVCEKDRHW